MEPIPSSYRLLRMSNPKVCGKFQTCRPRRDTSKPPPALIIVLGGSGHCGARQRRAISASQRYPDAECRDDDPQTIRRRAHMRDRQGITKTRPTRSPRNCRPIYPSTLQREGALFYFHRRPLGNRQNLLRQTNHRNLALRKPAHRRKCPIGHIDLRQQSHDQDE